MITKIYNTKINQTQTLKDFLVEHNFTGEYLTAFEYIVSTVPEELLRDKNGSLSKPFIALLVILSYFVGSSREDILKLAYAKDISALYDITLGNLKKEYDKYYDADPVEALSLNDFILSKENFHDYPEAYLLCLLAIEHGYRPKDIRDSIDEYIKELLQNRGVVEMLELSKAYRGSLTAIKEVLINEMVTKGLNAPTNLSITEPEPHKIDITNFDIPGGLIDKDSLLYRHLMRIKPAGTKIVFPEVIKNIFDNLVRGATLFSGIADTNSQGVILKENITPRPTSTELRTAPTVKIKQASAHSVHAVDIIITQTNPEPSIVEYRLTVTFPNGGYKVFAKRQVEVPRATLYSTNEKTVRFINGYKVPIELKVETIAIKRTSEPFMKRDLSGVYTVTIAENPHGITILNPEQPALDWEEIDEDLSFIKKFEFFEEFTGTHLQGCGFGPSELALIPATDYSIGDVIRGRLNKIGGSTCPTWAYFKVVAKYIPPSTPSRYVQTTTSDFDEFGNYTGTESYIILPKEKPDGYQIVNPNVIGVATNGDYLKSCENMFRNNPSLYLELDYLDTRNVTNMSWMFRNSQATTLDLSSFNTSKVTNMSNMFLSSQATTLDLSSFDTSSVTNMGGMFAVSQATTLDLSSFDTSNVTNMGGMFAYSQATELDLSSFDTVNVANMNDMFSASQATTGYARTQADADRFNGSLGKPSTLTFVVKPPA